MFPSLLRQVLDPAIGNRRHLCRLQFRDGVCHSLLHALPVSQDPLKIGGPVGLAYLVSCTLNAPVKPARAFRARQVEIRVVHHGLVGFVVDRRCRSGMTCEGSGEGGNGDERVTFDWPISGWPILG